jgi:hypothetical protein
MLAAAIEAKLAGARAQVRGDMVLAEVPLEDSWFRARLSQAPVAVVAVEVPDTDGFSLALRWNDRWAIDRAPRAATFDDSFLVETNDLVLAAAWLDHDSRSALLTSRYISAPGDRHTAVMLRDGAWEHHIGGAEVSARRRDAERSIDRMIDMLVATLAVASRPIRWARAFAAIAPALGARRAPRVEVGGRPVLRAQRGSTEVTVRLVRRLGPGDPGRLRTVVAARRIASDGATLSLIFDGLPRAAWPPTHETPTCIRIDARAAALLDAACPSATMVRTHDVEVAFDGALADRDRLAAAIELAAHWADAEVGPYR